MTFTLKKLHKPKIRNFVVISSVFALLLTGSVSTIAAWESRNTSNVDIVSGTLDVRSNAAIKQYSHTISGFIAPNISLNSSMQIVNSDTTPFVYSLENSSTGIANDKIFVKVTLGSQIIYDGPLKDLTIENRSILGKDSGSSNSSETLRLSFTWVSEESNENLYQGQSMNLSIKIKAVSAPNVQ